MEGLPALEGTEKWQEPREPKRKVVRKGQQEAGVGIRSRRKEGRKWKVVTELDSR